MPNGPFLQLRTRHFDEGANQPLDHAAPFSSIVPVPLALGAPLGSTVIVLFRIINKCLAATPAHDSPVPDMCLIMRIHIPLAIGPHVFHYPSAPDVDVVATDEYEGYGDVEICMMAFVSVSYEFLMVARSYGSETKVPQRENIEGKTDAAASCGSEIAVAAKSRWRKSQPRLRGQVSE